MVASFLRPFGADHFWFLFYDDFTIPQILLDSITPSGDVRFIIFQLIWSPVADEISEDLVFPMISPHDHLPHDSGEAYNICV